LLAQAFTFALSALGVLTAVYLLVIAVAGGGSD
jgi:hypothetical protein